jgi:hypothetical protein
LYHWSEKTGARLFCQEEKMHVSLLSTSEKSRSSNADDNLSSHFSTVSVQTDTGLQQNRKRVHGLDHSKIDVYQSQHKSAYNPFASALADAFGIEEAYS